MKLLKQRHVYEVRNEYVSVTKKCDWNKIIKYF